MKSTISHADVFEAMLEAQLQPKTYADYIKYIELYLEWCGQSVTPWKAESILDWMKDLCAKGYSSTYLVGKLCALKMYVYYGVQLGMIDARDAYYIEKFNLSRFPENSGGRPAIITLPLTDHQLEKILSKPDVSKPIGKRDFALLSLGVYCGFRRQEMLNVRVEDMRKGTIFVRGRMTREIKPPSFAKDALRPWIELVKRGPLCRSIKKSGLIGGDVGNAVPQGLEREYAITFRQLRITCARLMRAEGRSSDEICRYLGVISVRDNDSLWHVLKR